MVDFKFDLQLFAAATTITLPTTLPTGSTIYYGVVAANAIGATVSADTAGTWNTTDPGTGNYQATLNSSGVVTLTAAMATQLGDNNLTIVTGNVAFGLAGTEDGLAGITTATNGVIFKDASTSNTEFSIAGSSTAAEKVTKAAGATGAFTVGDGQTAITVEVAKVGAAAAPLKLVGADGKLITYTESSSADSFTVSGTATVLSTADGTDPVTRLETGAKLNVTAGNGSTVTGTGTVVVDANCGVISAAESATGTAIDTITTAGTGGATFDLAEGNLTLTSGIVTTFASTNGLDVKTGTATTATTTAGGNTVVFNSSTTAVATATGNVTGLAANGDITSASAGTLISTSAAMTSGQAVIIRTKKFISAGGSITITANATADFASAGNVLVDSSNTGSFVGSATTAVTYTGGSDGVQIAAAAAANNCVLTDVDKGETVTFNGNTYEGTGTKMLKVTVGAGAPVYYEISNGISGATITGAGVVTPAAGGTITVRNAGNIVLADHAGSANVYFNSAGVPSTESNDDTVVSVSNSTSNGTTTSTVKVTGALSGGYYIDTKGVVANVTDTSKAATTYNLNSANAQITLGTAGGSFSATTDGVISALSGTVTALADNKDYTTTVGDGKFNMTAVLNGSGAAATDGRLIFSAGTAINGAAITFATATTPNTMTLTESGNNNSTAVDTVIADTTTQGQVAISGVDGDFTVTKATTGSTITTTGSGTATINGVTWTVAKDDTGVTFDVNDSAKGKVGTITNLDKDATVSTTGKLNGDAITVMGTIFNSVTASNGVTFTSDGTNATAALMTAKDVINFTTATDKYTVLAVGGAGDGIVVGNGTLGALNDGDKIKVEDTTSTAYTIYEVSGNTLVTSEYASSTATKATRTTTYTLSDTTESFSVTAINTGTGLGTVGNADAGTTVDVVFGNPTSATTTNDTTLSDGLYVNSDGTTTTDSAKAVAKVNIVDDVITYVSQSSKAQEVSVSGANNKNDWNITTGAGKDDIFFNTNTNASVDAGAGDDVITLGGAGDKVVNTGDGKNTVNLGGNGDITLTLGAGKDTVSYAAASTGDLVITATGGDNVIDLSTKGTAGDVTVTGGTGNDTITASSEDNVISGGDGKDVFVVGSGIKVSDYSFDNDVIYTGTTAFNVTDSGNVSIAGGKADISSNAGDYYAAQIKTGTGKAQNWAWAKDGGSNIDITSFTKDAHLQGDGDGANALYAGSGNDEIIAVADGDTVYGGAGKNTVSLANGKEKRVVGVSVAAKSKDTVTGFKASFDDEGDSFFLIDGNLSDTTVTVDSVSGSAADLTLKNGSTSVSLVGAGVSTVTGAVEIKAGTTKLAAINKGATATVESASYADAYIGKDSIVDFSKVDGDLYVDLSNGLTGSGNGPKFVGITSVKGGAGASTLMGSAKADSIVAGAGKSTLWGGAGTDTLVGGSEADMFFVANGTNTNNVVSFTTADKDNADTVKVLGAVAGTKLNGNNVEISTADGSKAVVAGMNANSMIKIESDSFTGVAKIGASSAANNFTYDKSVTYYGGGSKDDKVSVASGFSDNAEVWLDGSKGVAYGSIDAVDFTNGTGNYVIAGDSSKNTIVGGKGDNTLWGGTGNSSDSIKGGSGNNLFFWGTGEGNDSISSSNANDTVNLYTVKLSDVDVANSSITNSGVVLALNDGSKLTVSTSKDINFTVDGTSWTAVHSTKSWKQNS